MNKLLRVSPLEKRSVEFVVDALAPKNGTVRGFAMTETWQFGYGFKEADDYINPDHADVNKMIGVYCEPNIGAGAELDGLIDVIVEFFGEFTEKEKLEIEALCKREKQDEQGRCGTAWVYDGNHEWEIEVDQIIILPPLQVDLVEDTGDGPYKVLKSDITLKPFDEFQKKQGAD